MIEDKDQFIRFARGRDIDEQKFQRATKHLLDVIIRKDFQDHHNHEKLRSIARVKLMELLNGDEIDLDRDPIPFLHRCITQRLHNELRDETRFSPDEHPVEDFSQVEEARTEPENVLDEIDIDVEPLLATSEEMEEHLKGIKLFKEYFNK